MRICGLDEAGRGALAGPLVAAGVILTISPSLISTKAGVPLKDSKLLSSSQRIKVYEVVKELGIEMAVEMVTTREINNHGIGWANKMIFRRLIKRLEADRYIIDGKLKIGRINGKTSRITSMIDADAILPEAILAGIIAKVTRDRLMHTIHAYYPIFDWLQNAGYGTKKHIEALMTLDMTKYHRRVFVTTALRTHAHPPN